MYYNLSLLFTYFLIYAMIGWTCEVVYCSLLKKKFVNRGFLNGPYCPIYGVGAVIIVIFLAPYINYPAGIFLVGIVTTSSLEYVTSWGMEKAFHAKWWDYSNDKFNINGRVCLKNSLLFGVMSLALMYLVHPFVQTLIQRLPDFWLEFIATFAFVLFIGDVVESTRETLVLNKKLGSVFEATTELKDALKEKGINTAHELTSKIMELKDGKLSTAKDSALNAVEYLTSRMKETKKFNSYAHRRILNAFPNMTHRKHPESLEVYKAFLIEDKTKKTSDEVPRITDEE